MSLREEYVCVVWKKGRCCFLYTPKTLDWVMLGVALAVASSNPTKACFFFFLFSRFFFRGPRRGIPLCGTFVRVPAMSSSNSFEYFVTGALDNPQNVEKKSAKKNMGL